MAVSHPRVWSLQVGWWRGVPVRVHVLFLLFSLATVALAWTADSYAAVQPDLVGIACLSIALLFLSVLVHALAHLSAGEHDPEVRAPNTLEIGPLGELSAFDCLTAHAELRVALAGPAANFCLVLLAGAVLQAVQEPDLAGLLHPLAPARLIEGPWGLVVLKLMLWINWMIVLANLCVPVLPLDGRRILRALIRLRWPAGERALPSRTIVVLARTLCICILLSAWAIRSRDLNGFLPAWCVVLLIASFVYLGALEEYRKDLEPEPESGPVTSGRQLAGHDAGKPEVVKSHPQAAMARIRTRRTSYNAATWCGACAPNVRPAGRESEEPSPGQEIPDLRDDGDRLDEILARIHQVGFNELTPAEKAWLSEESDRLRRQFQDHLSPPSLTQRDLR